MPTGFWVFMYRVSPFTYIISSLLSVGIAHAPVECTSAELTVFDPPADSTCAAYLEPYMSLAGGKLLNEDATSGCQYCTLDNTDTFLTSFKADYSERWRNVGIICVYLVFNIAAAVFLYWLARVPRGEKKMEVAAMPSGDATPEEFEHDAPKQATVSEKPVDPTNIRDDAAMSTSHPKADHALSSVAYPVVNAPVASASVKPVA